MNMKTILAAAAFAVTLPFAASAASIGSSAVVLTGVGDIDVFDETFCAVGNLNPDCTLFANIANGDTFEITVSNTSGTDLKVSAGLPASVNPDNSFTPQAMASFAGGTDVVLDNSTISAVIGAGLSTTYTITFGEPNFPLSNIDVIFIGGQVPVPAAGFLLLGGLGGLAALKRRKKA